LRTPAAVLRDKSLLRRVTAAAGVRNPESVTATGPADVRRFMAAYPGPVVLKPANRQASLGTIVLRETDDVDRAWHECVAMDEKVLVPDRAMPLHMLVERYVSGDEYSVEMLVHNGEPVFANVTEKTLYPGPRPIELGHVVPARVSDDVAATLRAGTVAVLRAVGFGTGVVHCEWILSDGTPYLVECAGRFPGDGIVELIDRAYSFHLAEGYFALMRGERPPPLPTTAEHGAAVRFLQIDPGEITSVDGLDAAAALPGVVHVSVSEPGARVDELRCSWDRPGSVMTCAATADDAMALAVKAIEQINVTTRVP
jgi:biotin carboxylase